jgi:lipase maturation factor
VQQEQTHDAVVYLFLKALGVIYLIAFVSFGWQAPGLIGQRGIQPLGTFLHRASEAMGASAYRVFPTVFWLASSDLFVRLVCLGGVACAALVVAGRMQRIALALCYVLYLSLVVAGQDFMSYQWDMLLLETGFLAIFLRYDRIIIWLFRWLLFRLMLLSGAVKLLSGDLAWRGLAALKYHYETQPLPTPLAWYVHQLPARFQQFSCAVMFAIELAAPFLLWAPRRWRAAGAVAIVFLQVLILLTGNYTFFNWITIALCGFALDDQMVPWFRVQARAAPAYGRTVATAAAIPILALSSVLLLSTLAGITWEPSNRLVRLAAPFGIVNSYGLFAVMTTTRDEIIVEGSNDGARWQPYEFKDKPGDVYRAPPVVAPFQPRLDWQMWFAALGSYRDNPWFVNFAVRLLQGSPEVLRLLKTNPFPDGPPRYVRAGLFRYWFTDWSTGRKTGAWWNRAPRGLYLPAISLEDVRVEGM